MTGPEHRVPVVVVGAGPVGLAVACVLRQRGVDVRVLESADEPHRGSRAVQLHPPTLAVFRELGLLAEAENQGLKIHTTHYHLAGGRTLRVRLGAENEPLMLEQEHTSRLLEETLQRLGGSVQRATRVTHVGATDGLVTVKALGPAGTELIETDWLVAADGVRSQVREQLGIDFTGRQVPTGFLLAEGKVGGTYEDNAVHYFLGSTGSVVFGSMRGGRVRISGAVPDGYPLTPEGVQRLLDERGPGGLTVSGLDMISHFSSQERIASALRQGRCFLVGDAAHTHSPLGGQGLNLGLQDAHNLGWKLAGVINGTLRPAVLDTYEPERRQAAEQIVRVTHQLLKAFTLGPVGARVRNTTWATLERTGTLRRWFVPLLAGRRIRYPDLLTPRPAPGADRFGGALTRSLPVRSLPVRSLPAVGSRAPAWVPAPPAGTPPLFRLVTVGQGRRDLTGYARALAGRWPGLLHHSQVPGRTAGFLLLRPDGYVAAAGTAPADLARARNLLAELFHDRSARTTS